MLTRRWKPPDNLPALLRNTSSRANCSESSLIFASVFSFEKEGVLKVTGEVLGLSTTVSGTYSSEGNVLTYEYNLFLDFSGTVTVEFADDGSIEEYKLVTTVRCNSVEGLISTESPVGKALLGHKVGERVHVQVNPQVGYDLIIKAIKDFGQQEDIQIKFDFIKIFTLHIDFLCWFLP